MLCYAMLTALRCAVYSSTYCTCTASAEVQSLTVVTPACSADKGTAARVHTMLESHTSPKEEENVEHVWN